MNHANTGGLGMSKESDVVTVTWKEMDDNGEFDCPKCKVKISPELEGEWEDISEVDHAPEILLIKHLCGQKIAIDMTGFEEERRSCSEP